MPSIKGFTCTLTLDGHSGPATEYGTQTEGNDYASAYIVAESHKRFTLTVEATKFVHPSLDIAVWIDGKYQDGRIMMQSEKKFGFREKFTGKEERVRGRMVKKIWKFGDLNVVDERTIDCEHERDVLLNLGTIEVVVLRCNDSESTPFDDSDSDSDSEPEQEPHPRAKEYWKHWEADQNDVPRKGAQKGKSMRPTINKNDTEKPIFEKHLKGRDLRHRVVTEKEFLVKRQNKEKTIEYLDQFENPYCIMALKYRSRAALQNLDYIPLTPRASPTPSEDEVEPDPEEIARLETLSRAELMREFLRLRRAASSPRIKQEAEEEDPEEGRRARKRTKVKREIIEVVDGLIDLTDN